MNNTFVTVFTVSVEGHYLPDMVETKALPHPVHCRIQSPNLPMLFTRWPHQDPCLLIPQWLNEHSNHNQIVKVNFITNSKKEQQKSCLFKPVLSSVEHKIRHFEESFGFTFW